MVSLAVGWPAPGARPGSALRRHAEAALAEHIDEITTDYGDPAGAADLAGSDRNTVDGDRRGAYAGEVVVTNGASQGLHLVLPTMVEPGDVVAVESPTYAGVLDAVRSRQGLRSWAFRSTARVSRLMCSHEP